MYQTKNIPTSASVKDIDGKKGIIVGYFADFDTWDSDNDLIPFGAFTKTIGERGPNSKQPRIKHLRNHFIYEPVGVLTSLKEEAKGLYYESQPGTHSIGQDTVKMIESGIITEHSFGFDVIRKEVINPDADWYQQKRKLLEIKMWEGSSLTAWGANERTGAATMKSMGKDAYVKMISDRAASVEKFCRSTTATDETIEFLLLEHKQLTQLLLDISEKSTTPDDKSTLPESEILDVFSTFSKSLKN
jgi:HK97 family phage prohead protease